VAAAVNPVNAREALAAVDEPVRNARRYPRRPAGFEVDQLVADLRLPRTAPVRTQPEWPAPQALRPVRQHPPGEVVRGRQSGRARYRPGHRAGEHPGLYTDRNTYAVALGIFTRDAVERIAHTAFRLARRRRNKVTIVHKANVLRLTTGLFRDVCREVAGQYPGVALDDHHVDASSAPDIAGRDLANPIAGGRRGDHRWQDSVTPVSPARGRPTASAPGAWR
jgi:hypothetical protein